MPPIFFGAESVAISSKGSYEYIRNQQTPRGGVRPQDPKGPGRKGLSLTNLAQRTGISVSYLSEVENDANLHHCKWCND